MAAPAVLGRVLRIVVRKIIVGRADRLARFEVPKVLVAERARVVLDVIEHMQRAVRRIVEQAQPGFVRLHQHLKPAVRRDVDAPDLGPAGYRDREIIGEAAQVGRGRGQVAMPVDAEGLFRELILRHAVKVMHRRLGTPTDVEAAVHVGLRPVEDPAQLIPVGDLLERQRLHRRAGDDETVEALVPDVLPVTIE